MSAPQVAALHGVLTAHSYRTGPVTLVVFTTAPQQAIDAVRGKERKPMPVKTSRKSDPEDKRLGELLRAARLEAGISQTELGTKLGVTFQQIQKYEKGANRISGGRLKQAARALGLPMAYFYPVEDEGAEGDATPSVSARLMSSKYGLDYAVAFVNASPDQQRVLRDIVQAATATGQVHA